MQPAIPATMRGAISALPLRLYTGRPLAAERLGISFAWAAGLAAAFLGLLAVLMLTGSLDASGVWRAAGRVETGTLAAIIALSLASYACRAIKWHILSRELAPSVRLGQSLGYFLTGFAFTLTPAKVGELVRLWLLKSRHDVSYARSVGLMAIDRLVDLGCLLAFAALAAIVGLVPSAGAASALVVLAAAIMVPKAHRRLAGIIVYAHAVTGRRRPGLFRALLSTVRALGCLSRPPVMVPALMLGATAWGAQIAGTWLLLNALGLAVDPLFAALVFTATVMVVLVPVLPAGVGGAEAVMTSMLLAAGMPLETAVAATILSRLMTLWLAVAVGFIVAPFVLGRRQQSTP